MIDHSAWFHRLKITLVGITPSIWRTIEVRSDTPLDVFAAQLEGVMGWEGDHLHGFVAKGVRYDPSVRGAPDFGGLMPGRTPVDESTVVIGEVLTGPKAKMTWTYDFGDNWEHEIVVATIEAVDPDVEYPRCLDGRRAGPPEDCGGWWGYENLLEAIADPDHADHDELADWLGDGLFDPEQFDADQATRAMRAHRPMW